MDTCSQKNIFPTKKQNILEEWKITYSNFFWKSFYKKKKPIDYTWQQAETKQTTQETPDILPYLLLMQKSTSAAPYMTPKTEGNTSVSTLKTSTSALPCPHHTITPKTFLDKYAFHVKSNGYVYFEIIHDVYGLK